MKSTIVENARSIIDSRFEGLAEDKDGGIWLFTNADSAVIVFVRDTKNADIGYIRNKSNAIELYGPFTKFNGTVTLEND